MCKLMSIIKNEPLSDLTFKAWTDGPKYVIDTIGVAQDYPGVTSVVTAMNEQAMSATLDHFHQDAIATIYVLGNTDLVSFAIVSRPDLDIRWLTINEAA